MTARRLIFLLAGAVSLDALGPGRVVALADAGTGDLQLPELDARDIFNAETLEETASFERSLLILTLLAVLGGRPGAARPA